MKAIEFKHQTIVFAKDQPEYLPLPALKIKGREGQVISCWKMSIKERIRVLFTGVVWMNLMSFNKPLTPSYLSTRRKDVYSLSTDKDIKKIVKSNVKLFKDLRKKHSV